MNRFVKIGEIADPYEQRWVMRSVRFQALVGAGWQAERCA
jgi:hypothetical protein